MLSIKTTLAILLLVLIPGIPGIPGQNSRIPGPGGASAGGGPPTISFGTKIVCTAFQSGGPTFTCNVTIPSCTHLGAYASWGGTAHMTAVTLNSNVSASGVVEGATAGVYFGGLALWINPTSGSSIPLTFTFTGGDFVADVFPICGINQTGTVGNSFHAGITSNDGGSGAPSPTSVVVSNALSGEKVIDSVLVSDTTMTVGGSQTQLDKILNPAGDGFSWGTSSQDATGSTTMQWTYTGSQFWAQAGISLIPG